MFFALRYQLNHRAIWLRNRIRLNLAESWHFLRHAQGDGAIATRGLFALVALWGLYQIALFLYSLLTATPPSAGPGMMSETVLS